MLKPEKYDKKPNANVQFNTASAVVYGVLEDLQYGEERFNQFLKWEFDAVNRFSFDVYQEVHVGEFEMKPWKQICMPDNMVSLSVIGFRCGDTVKVFTVDRSIPKLFDKEDCIPQENKSCIDISAIEPIDTIVPFYPGNFYGDHYYGQLCDYNYHGYFDLDWRERVINFKRPVNNINKVYMEWVTDGINPTGATIVHPMAKKAHELFVHWQRKEFDDRFGLSEKQRAKEIFEEEEDKVLVRLMDLSIDDIKEALRTGYRQTIKN